MPHLARILGAWAAVALLFAAAAAPAVARAELAILVVDAHNGRILQARDADSQRYPASLTKIMTLYLLFQELRSGRVAKDSRFLVSAHAARQAPSRLGLKPGETIRVEDAIRALTTKSANDVAVLVAENISGSEAAFAQRMTETARRLGMSRTRFRNASGLPDPGQVTTARDMATLGLRVMRDFPEYYGYFGLRYFLWHGRAIRTHNRLLGRFEGTDGIKTGYTRASGFNLVSSVRRQGRHLVGVVLGAPSAGARNALMMRMLTGALARASVPEKAAVAGSAAEAPVATASLEPAPSGARVVTAPMVPASTDAAGRFGMTESSRAKVISLLPAAQSVLVASPPVAASAAPVSAKSGAGDGLARGASWQIQIGAFATKAEAEARLTSARTANLATLRGKSALTLAVETGAKTIYRARFSGFAERSAKDACRALSRRAIGCLALAPAS